MSTPAQPHVPFDPIRRAAGCDTVKATARLLGLDRKQIHRWMSGGIPVDTADRLAIQIGHHPAELWADWYEITDVEQVAS